MSIVGGKRLLIVAGDPPMGDQETLGLGDLMRVLTLVPNFGAAHVDWVSPENLSVLVGDCPFIVGQGGEADLDAFLAATDHVLNLTHRDLDTQLPVTEVRDALDLAGDGTFKKKVYDLPGNLAALLDCPSQCSMTVAETKSAPAYDVGFNFRAPDHWKIKEMPRRHWEEVAALLPDHLSISWQPEETNLADYFDWIKNCKVLLASVGFGCHVAAYYGRELVMLSGPTDFAEVHDYGRATVLYPPSICEHRPCYQPNGVANCGCMPDFIPSELATAVLSHLETSVS